MKAHLADVRAYQGAMRAREHDAIERMSSMTREEQLPYVEKYFSQVNHGRPVGSLADTYMGMFWPSAIGKGPDYVVAHADSKGFERLVYAQNSGLDANKDGQITSGEAAGLVAGASGAPSVRALVLDIERYAKRTP